MRASKDLGRTWWPRTKVDLRRSELAIQLLALTPNRAVFVSFDKVHAHDS